MDELVKARLHSALSGSRNDSAHAVTTVSCVKEALSEHTSSPPRSQLRKSTRWWGSSRRSPGRGAPGGAGCRLGSLLSCGRGGRPPTPALPPGRGRPRQNKCWLRRSSPAARAEAGAQPHQPRGATHRLQRHVVCKARREHARDRCGALREEQTEEEQRRIDRGAERKQEERGRDLHQAQHHHARPSDLVARDAPHCPRQVPNV
eukprot:scaffold88953_cov63-Phaeocystis_antarctica.AAC.2